MIEQVLVWFLYKASMRTQSASRKQYPNRSDRLLVKYVGRRFRAQVDGWWCEKKKHETL